jgi:hypothetical protein
MDRSHSAELGGLQRFADPETRKRPGDVAEAFLSQVKGDAGTRNRRYQYIEVFV